MIVFPRMLVPAAEAAGMSYPKDPDEFESEKDTFTHFYVFCLLQLARPLRAGEHFDNAKVIAEISKEKILTMTLRDLIEAGFEYHLDPV